MLQNGDVPLREGVERVSWANWRWVRLARGLKDGADPEGMHSAASLPYAYVYSGF